MATVQAQLQVPKASIKQVTVDALSEAVYNSMHSNDQQEFPGIKKQIEARLKRERMKAVTDEKQKAVLLDRKRKRAAPKGRLVR